MSLIIRGGKKNSGKKTFVFRENGRDTSMEFTNRQPRGAALKAANRGYTKIRLREKGTNKIHVFEGWTKKITNPNEHQQRFGITKVANVRKVGIEHV